MSTESNYMKDVKGAASKGAISAALLATVDIAKSKDVGISTVKVTAAQFIGSSIAYTVTDKLNFGYIDQTTSTDIAIEALITAVISTLGMYFIGGKKGLVGPFVISAVSDIAASGLYNSM